MYASFDQSSAKTKSFAAVAWKDNRPVAWERFKPRVTEPIYDRYRDLIDQALEWLVDLEQEHEELFVMFAVEEFVDYKSRYKNRAMAQLDQFTGYLVRSLETRDPERFTKVIKVGKGTAPKHKVWSFIKNYIPPDMTDDNEKDALLHGILANFHHGRGK